MTTTADRGGPFVPETDAGRNWMRAPAPGIAPRAPPNESSPIGGDALRKAQLGAGPGHARSAHLDRSTRLQRGPRHILVLLVVCAMWWLPRR